MARIAFVLVGSGGELAAMPVGVTCRAGHLSRDIHGVFAFWFMAIHAFDIGVLSLEREGALFVGLLVKQSRLEALFVMTRGAVGARSAGLELPFVGIFVTIGTPLKRDLPVVVAILVALSAGSFLVFAFEREFRGAVIEVLARTVEFPARGNVALFASAAELGFLESAAVGVHVAALASAVHQAFEENRLALSMRLVALLAGDCLMFSGEGVVGAAVVETGRRFPGILGMTAGTVVSLLPPVHVLMAGSALPAKAEE
jgi:hypothetical protein